jgi:hypothetical protein
MEAILESTKYFHWKRGATRDTKPKPGSPRRMNIG